MHKINYIFTALAIITMTFISCQKDNEEDDIDVITREYVGSYTITVGDTLSLDITSIIQKLDTIFQGTSNVSCNEIAYTSNNPQIASVTDGVVTGLKAGKTSITVSIYQKGKQSPHHIYKYDVIVRDKLDEITDVDKKDEYKSFTIFLPKQEYCIGDTAKVQYYINDSDTIEEKDILWTTTDQEIAIIQDNGTIEFINEGKCTIMAFIKGTPLDAYYQVNVSTKINSITLNTQQATICLGEETSIIATTNPPNVTNKPIKWSVTDNSIVEFKELSDNTIMIKGTGIGETTIIATTNNEECIAKCNITVTQPYLRDIEVEKSYIEVNVNMTNQVFVHAIPSIMELPQLKWKSLTPDIVSVDQNGIVKGISKGYGSIVIETMDGAISKTIQVNVKDITDFIYISGISSAIINVGGYRKGSVSTTIRNASNVDVVLKKFEVIDNSTNQLIAYTEDEAQLGILHPAEERTLGVNQITIDPNTTLSFIWTGMYNGREFQVIGYY